MISSVPGRFSRATIHTDAGEAELRLSAAGNWQLRLRAAGEDEWRFACSGDLDSGAAAPRLDQHESPLRLGQLSLDRAARRALVHGREIPLARREFDLLETLAAEPNRVFTKRELLRRWGYRDGLRTRTLDSHASRLRVKLRNAGADGLIVSCHGVGYRFWRGTELAAAQPDRAA